MNPRIDQMMEDILEVEKGYVNNPNDDGGATNHGISLRYIRMIGFDRNNDGVIDENDIIELTIPEAKDFFLADFYYQPRINRAPEEIQPVLFDMSVNHGGPATIMMLQKSLNHWAQHLIPDGVYGPQTAKALLEVESRIEGNWGEVINVLISVRTAFYRDIVRHKPEKGEFLNGWLIRAESFRERV